MFRGNTSGNGFGNKDGQDLHSGAHGTNLPTIADNQPYDCMTFVLEF